MINASKLCVAGEEDGNNQAIAAKVVVVDEAGLSSSSSIGGCISGNFDIGTVFE